MAVFKFNPPAFDTNDRPDVTGLRVLHHQADVGAARHRTRPAKLVRIVGEYVGAVAISHAAILGSATRRGVIVRSTTRRRNRTQFGLAMIVTVASEDILRNDDRP